jgi:hypothetical protein
MTQKIWGTKLRNFFCEKACDLILQHDKNLYCPVLKAYQTEDCLQNLKNCPKDKVCLYKVLLLTNIKPNIEKRDRMRTK